MPRLPARRGKDAPPVSPTTALTPEQASKKGHVAPHATRTHATPWIKGRAPKPPMLNSLSDPPPRR